MKTLPFIVLGTALLAGVLILAMAPHRAAAQAGEYAALFARCSASGGYPGSTVEDWNNGFCKNCPHGGSGGATCPQAPADSADSGGRSNDLATESANALVKGMMNGNSQEFGLGVGGLILNDLLQGSQDDGAAAAEAARQAEQARQDSIRAQQEYARRMALAKGRILGVLKDSTDEGGDPFRPDTGIEGAVATVHEGPLTVGGLQLKSDDGVQQASLPKPDSDPMVVDARNVPSGLPKDVDDAINRAYANAPPGVIERVRKGFEAVETKDWNVARAWFQDALNRDPNNAGLKNLIADLDAAVPKDAPIVAADEELRDAPNNAPTAADQAALRTALNSNIPRAGDAPVSIAPLGNEAPVSIEPLPLGPADRADVKRIVGGLDNLAGQMPWSDTKRTAFAKTMDDMVAEDYLPSLSSDTVRGAWREVNAQDRDATLLRDASQDGGMGWASTGLQTPGQQDCTIFALANATGRPYPVVAAEATDLIRKADWRSSGERDNPEAAIEQRGLNGLEVAMLAESFGHATAVPEGEFAQSLKQGHPVMVDLAPPDGNLRGGHQAVLTKTFEHDGQTWYVMMDSMQAAPHFVSAAQLEGMVKEKGIAYQPGDKTVVALP